MNKKQIKECSLKTNAAFLHTDYGFLKGVFYSFIFNNTAYHYFKGFVGVTSVRKIKLVIAQDSSNRVTYSDRNAKKILKEIPFDSVGGWAKFTLSGRHFAFFDSNEDILSVFKCTDAWDVTTAELLLIDTKRANTGSKAKTFF